MKDFFQKKSVAITITLIVVAIAVVIGRIPVYSLGIQLGKEKL